MASEGMGSSSLRHAYTVAIRPVSQAQTALDALFALYPAAEAFAEALPEARRKSEESVAAAKLLEVACSPRPSAHCNCYNTVSQREYARYAARMAWIKAQRLGTPLPKGMDIDADHQKKLDDIIQEIKDEEAAIAKLEAEVMQARLQLPTSSHVNGMCL